MKQKTPPRNVKSRTAADVHDILDRLARLPIETWSYTFEPGVRHIGPMAQDFAELFEVGGNPRRIELGDAVGVAYAAVQALQELLKANETRIAGLRAELDALRQSSRRSPRAKKKTRRA